MVSPVSFVQLKKQALEQLKSENGSYRALTEPLKEDAEVTWAYLEKMPWCLFWAPKKFHDDRKLLFFLMEKDPWIFVSVSDELKSDVTFVLKAIEKTRGLAYFLCKQPVADLPQVKAAAQSQGVLLHG